MYPQAWSSRIWNLALSLTALAVALRLLTAVVLANWVLLITVGCVVAGLLSLRSLRRSRW